jgi:hypothetical protein
LGPIQIANLLRKKYSCVSLEEISSVSSLHISDQRFSTHLQHRRIRETNRYLVPGRFPTHLIHAATPPPLVHPKHSKQLSRSRAARVSRPAHTPSRVRSSPHADARSARPNPFGTGGRGAVHISSVFLLCPPCTHKQCTTHPTTRRRLYKQQTRSIDRRAATLE